MLAADDTLRKQLSAVRLGPQGPSSRRSRQKDTNQRLSQAADELNPMFLEILEQDLKDGEHRNPTSSPAYFTTTYFHLPEELKQVFR